MKNKESAAIKKVLQVIQQINEDWLNKRYAEIGNLVSENVVIVPPGFANRIQGRDAYVQSYRDYDKSATTHTFSPNEPIIDLIGDTAVAVYTFYIVYEIDGKTYKENGRELLVLSCSSGAWLVVWRTMFIDSNS